MGNSVTLMCTTGRHAVDQTLCEDWCWGATGPTMEAVGVSYTW